MAEHTQSNQIKVFTYSSITKIPNTTVQRCCLPNSYSDITSRAIIEIWLSIAVIPVWYWCISAIWCYFHCKIKRKRHDENEDERKTTCLFNYQTLHNISIPTVNATTVVLLCGGSARYEKSFSIIASNFKLILSDLFIRQWFGLRRKFLIALIHPNRTWWKSFFHSLQWNIPKLLKTAQDNE